MVDTRPTVDPSWLFSGPDAPEESELYKCVHCGFCLQACPTYLETGLETESPRGRIALMKAVNEGRIGMTDSVVRHWDLVYPVQGLRGSLPFRSALRQPHRSDHGPGGAKAESWSCCPRLAAGLALNHIIPNQGRARIHGSNGPCVSAYRNSVASEEIRPASRLVSRSLADMESSMPDSLRQLLQGRGPDAVAPTGEVKDQGRPALRMRHAAVQWQRDGRRSQGAQQERMRGGGP